MENWPRVSSLARSFDFCHRFLTLVLVLVWCWSGVGGGAEPLPEASGVASACAQARPRDSPVSACQLYCVSRPNPLAFDA